MFNSLGRVAWSYAAITVGVIEVFLIVWLAVLSARLGRGGRFPEAWRHSEDGEKLSHRDVQRPDLRRQAFHEALRRADRRRRARLRRTLRREERASSSRILVVVVALIVASVLLAFAWSQAIDLHPARTEARDLVLEDLARNGVNDLDMLKTQQAEILKALRSPESTQNGSRRIAMSANTEGTVGLADGNAIFYLFSLLGIPIGIILLTSARRYTLPNRALLQLLGGLSLAAPIGVTLWKADTLFKIEGLRINFPTGEAAIPRQPYPINIVFGSSNPSVKLECLDNEKQSLFPFLEGTSDIDAEKVETSLKAVNDWVNQKRNENARLVGLFVIGSTDKRPLRFQLRQKYGDNPGLAMDRATKIAKDLESDLSLPRSSIMTIYDGPSIFGTVKSSDDLAPDRAVRVCALWN